jgi:hypothetical protein
VPLITRPLRLVIYLTEHIKCHYGKTQLLGIVRINNAGMVKTLGLLGYKVAGRLQFVEISGLRLHYLRGREAFAETRKRLFLALPKSGNHVQ